MMSYKKTFRLMNEAGEGGDTGGGGTAVDAVATATGGEGQAASVLATGATAATETVAPIHETIPEKYRVNKEDGTFDLEASARKLADGQAHLEKRLGSGDVPPKTADDYALELPEGIDFEALKGEPEMQALLKSGHEAGLNNKQMSWAVNQMIAAVQGNAEEVAAQATATLKDVWKTDAEFKQNVDQAYKAASAFMEPAELEQFMKRGGPGDNASIIKMLAKVGAEMGEDKPVADANSSTSEAQSVSSLMASDAYSNPKHPEHSQVKAKVDAYYNKTYGTNPVQ
jgi:hypothetical protein